MSAAPNICVECGETRPEPASYCLFRSMRAKGHLPRSQGCDYSREGDVRLRANMAAVCGDAAPVPEAALSMARMEKEMRR